MAIGELEKRIVNELGLGSLGPQEQEAALKMVDERLEKRFVANLLFDLPEDKKRELEQKVEAMENPTPESVFDAAIGLHPNAQGVLEKSAKDIIDEMKASMSKTAPAPEAPKNEAETSGQEPSTSSTQPQMSPAAQPEKGQTQSDGESFPPAPPTPTPPSPPAEPEPAKPKDETLPVSPPGDEGPKVGGQSSFGAGGLAETPDYYQPASQEITPQKDTSSSGNEAPSAAAPVPEAPEQPSDPALTAPPNPPPAEDSNTPPTGGAAL